MQTTASRCALTQKVPSFVTVLMDIPWLMTRGAALVSNHGHSISVLSLGFVSFPRTSAQQT